MSFLHSSDGHPSDSSFNLSNPSTTTSFNLAAHDSMTALLESSNKYMSSLTSHLFDNYMHRLQNKLSVAVTQRDIFKTKWDTATLEWDTLQHLYNQTLSTWAAAHASHGSSSSPSSSSAQAMMPSGDSPPSIMAPTAPTTAVIPIFTKADAPSTQFWMHKDYNNWLSSTNNWDNNHGPTGFLETKDGKVLACVTLNQLCKLVKRIWRNMAKNNMLPAKWEQLSLNDLEEFVCQAYNEWPLAGYCTGTWKIDVLCSINLPS
ncbi:hypothetical protein CONPUDRAFT_158794 [Coniophora puteana RWD-64-598 SS2]|uniref:Uncharacterized protein n=1 Tax=Coniophora puteana (strain RWD-64-598) TaxID=741705 RepID=A0A5M3M9U1_CONPW|nr:uncharacterized protein CONPUDRAFT_158794 [Coniophora puteana RWD-64-598 SS2]EIW76018.1 hypothetical protein CONPUDRAFT_158794 [Coniophora puteana RWD-64-598 SS2]